MRPDRHRHAAVDARLIGSGSLFKGLGSRLVSLIAVDLHSFLNHRADILRVDQRAGSDGERATSLRAVLEQILPMLAETEIVALVEPIGFTASSMKFQREATDVIESMGAVDRLAIVHDTFQHALAGDEDILVPWIRLVHISGVVEGDGPLTEAQDARRGLIDGNDRSGACGEIKALLDLGYAGPLSFECTSSSMRSLRDPSAQITDSIAFVRRVVGNGTSVIV